MNVCQTHNIRTICYSCHLACCLKLLHEFLIVNAGRSQSAFSGSATFKAVGHNQVSQLVTQCEWTILLSQGEDKWFLTQCFCQRHSHSVHQSVVLFLLLFVLGCSCCLEAASCFLKHNNHFRYWTLCHISDTFIIICIQMWCQFFSSLLAYCIGVLCVHKRNRLETVLRCSVFLYF